jgi:hypothetical protein
MMHVLRDIAGVELPGYMGSMKDDEPRDLPSPPEALKP